MHWDQTDRDRIAQYLEPLIREAIEGLKPLALSSLSGWRKWAVRLLWSDITEKILLVAAMAAVDALVGLVAVGAMSPQVIEGLVDRAN